MRISTTTRVASLHVYPVKSCRGITLTSATLATAGLAHDREWLVVDATSLRFMTQRELPRLALIETALEGEGASGFLVLHAPGVPTLRVGLEHEGPRLVVTCWRDQCAAFDAGDEAAQWCSGVLGRACRLVRFDPAGQRASDPAWTGGELALNKFSDGFPILVIGSASLQDLRARVGRELPMNRFRPNLVIDGLAPYGEDRIAQLQSPGITLMLVKPCTRCVITTTDQASGERDGNEPLATLRGYRWNPQLRGVMFGQNAMIRRGRGGALTVGMSLEAS